jgi:mono/diheme cytochrome c family protein
VLKRVVDALQVVALLAAAVFVLLLFVNEPDDSAAATTGKQLFTTNCAGCHGPEGEGAAGPRLAGTVVVEYPDVEDQAAVVRDGRGLMPSFRNTLTPAQIDDVVAYTRTGLPSS